MPSYRPPLTDLDGQALTTMVIHSRQQPESLPTDPLIGHEVHAPAVIGTLSDRTSFRMISATDVPDSACLNASAICSSVTCFFPIRKTTLSGGGKVKKPNSPDGSRNGGNVSSESRKCPLLQQRKNHAVEDASLRLSSGASSVPSATPVQPLSRRAVFLREVPDP